MTSKEDIICILECVNENQINYNDLDLEKMTNTIPDDVRIYLKSGTIHKKNLYTLKIHSKFDFKKILDILIVLESGSLKDTNPEFFL